MRPWAAMGVVKWRTLFATSDDVPPLKTGAPVARSSPRSCSEPSAPRAQTIASFVPSLVVMMGEPLPPELAHHTTDILLAAAASCLTPTRSPEVPPGQPTPELPPLGRMTT